MTVEATVVVEFGEGADSSALVVVELDGEVNKDSDGNEITTFEPEMDAYFLVHFDSSLLTIGSVKSSAGNIAGGKSVTRERTQQLSFTEADTGQDLSYIPAGSVDYEWYGDEASVTISGRTVKADSAPVICDATYNINAKQYYLVPPSMTLAEDEQFPVLIVVTMEAKA